MIQHSGIMFTALWLALAGVLGAVPITLSPEGDLALPAAAFGGLIDPAGEPQFGGHIDPFGVAFCVSKSGGFTDPFGVAPRWSQIHNDPFGVANCDSQFGGFVDPAGVMLGELWMGIHVDTGVPRSHRLIYICPASLASAKPHIGNSDLPARVHESMSRTIVYLT